MWAFYYADNRGCGKLVDDLSSGQFNLLVRILSCLASEQDFKSLLTLENIWEATDHLEDFVPLDILRIIYLGSTNAGVRKWVQSSLIECINEGACEEMGSEEDM